MRRICETKSAGNFLENVSEELIERKTCFDWVLLKSSTQISSTPDLHNIRKLHIATDVVSVCVQLWPLLLL